MGLMGLMSLIGHMGLMSLIGLMGFMGPTGFGWLQSELHLGNSICSIS